MTALFNNLKYKRNAKTSTEGVWLFVDDEKTLKWKLSSANTNSFQKALVAALQGKQGRGRKQNTAVIIDLKPELVAERLVHGWQYESVITDKEGNEVLDESGIPQTEWKTGFPFVKFQYEDDGSVSLDQDDDPIILETKNLEACTPRNVLLVFEEYKDIYEAVDDLTSDTEKFGLLNTEDTKS